MFPSLATHRPLVVFGCCHIGAKTADMKMLDRYIKFVKRTNAYALLLADNHECAVPRKGEMMMEQDLTPQEQLDYGIEAFSPIAKNIVGACTGNHANRAYKGAGLEMDKIMADRLGYRACYFTWQGLVSVKPGNLTYKISFKHGTGAGSDDFRNARELLKSFPMSDICCSSHTHRLSSGWGGYFDVNGRERSVHPVSFISTGSLLDYPRYADEAGYQPQRKGFAILWIGKDRREIIPDTSGAI